MLTQGVRICGLLQLVSELRLVITLALVEITQIESVVLYNGFERINRYERVFVSEYKMVLYCVDWFMEWYMNLRRHSLENCIEGVSKHLNRTIDTVLF